MAVPLFVVNEERNTITRKRRLLENFSDFEVQKLTGLPQWGVKQLINFFKPIEGLNVLATPLETKVLCFLSHLRSGSFQYMLGSSSGLAQPTVSKILEECLNFLLSQSKSFINFPETLEALNQSKQAFAAISQFPNVIGLIDGSQIAIKAPKENEPVFVCRKQFHSINTQVICGPDFSFYDIVAKWPGSTHDSFIWNNCGAKVRLYNGELGDGWLLGDSGYPLEERLLTPYLRENCDSHQRYNNNHKRTRCLVERAIGNWKSRFRCIDRTGGTLCYGEQKACKIILATAILHNICIKKQIPLTEEDQHYRDFCVIPNLHNITPATAVSNRRVATEIRDRTARAFN